MDGWVVEYFTVLSKPVLLTGSDEDRLLLRHYLGATAFSKFSIVYMNSVFLF